VAATDTGPEGRTVLTLNAFMRDSNGNIVLECQGIRAIELEKSEGFPAMVFESSVQISKLESDLRNADENDFLSSLLSNEEISEYKSKKVPKRASEWLAGRAALKRSIQRLYQRYGNTVPAASKISILQDDQGKPMARVHGTEANLIGDLSISHSNGLAVACAAAAGSSVGLGIDIEKVEPRTESWINDYFSNDEIDALKTSKDKWISSTKMWSLKEAALKAFGTGLRVDLRNISILLTDREDSAKIQFHNDAADIPGVKNGCNIEAKVQEQDGMVTARVMLRNR
jgi:phosphopantetheine--protein transferase-like protein